MNTTIAVQEKSYVKNYFTINIAYATSEYIRKMLACSNFKKKYGAIPVIDIPLLTLEQGIYWLKGAKGSGKTTFLKLMAGLLHFEGDIQLNHISIRKNAVAYRQLMSRAEAEPLFPAFLSGSNLVSLFLDIKKLPNRKPAI